MKMQTFGYLLHMDCGHSTTRQVGPLKNSGFDQNQNLVKLICHTLLIKKTYFFIPRPQSETLSGDGC